MYIDSFESSYHYGKATGYRGKKWPELYTADFTKTERSMVDFGALVFSKEECARRALTAPSLHVVPTVPDAAHRTLTPARALSRPPTSMPAQDPSRSHTPAPTPAHPSQPHTPVPRLVQVQSHQPTPSPVPSSTSRHLAASPMPSSTPRQRNRTLATERDDTALAAITSPLPTPPATHANIGSITPPSRRETSAESVASPSPPVTLPAGIPKGLEASYGMLTHTVGLGWGSRWVSCIQRFLTDEEALGFPDPGGKQLASALRPEEFAQWFKEGRQSRGVAIGNIETFAKNFYSWYRKLQPPARGVKGLNRVTIHGDAWSSIRRPGKNGTFLILVGLSWIAQRVHGGQNAALVANWSEVVDDLCWVMEESSPAPMTGLPAIATSKRRQAPPEGSRKRARRQR